ncbi:hypothetical protein A374_02854 [Fictibacillus macauensis ZFHKF-1]|uniref:Uncharacterized protein n=1 Tax=Fictibacillus macauensis ZFHKF-1 TaxID=1196324 RepID=I8UK03_9BACL|nr:hypothetical protein A374_02854 [Fictibacillus macauensis ZFHKF-1]
MEKALHKAHGIGFAEYERSLTKRIDVEVERQKEYVKSLEISHEMQRKIL